MNAYDVLEALLSALALRTIYVSNELDQPVNIAIFGCLEEDGTGVQLDTLTVDAGSQDFRTLITTVTGAVPYVYVTAQCDSAPTSGKVTISWLEKSAPPVTMLEEEIRDTDIYKSDYVGWWM